MTTNKLRILVLDDSEIVLNMVALALGEAGFEVLTAGSLVEFERALEGGLPNIILTDIHLPEIRGDNVCRVLKQKMETGATPIILFSTLPEDELAALAERAHADGFVSKNSGIDQVVRRIQELSEEILF
jgi:CheY-like chemotaxis protein